MEHSEGEIRVGICTEHPSAFDMYIGHGEGTTVIASCLTKANAERIRDLWNAFVGITTHKAMNVIQAAKSLMDNPDDLKYLEHGKEMVKALEMAERLLYAIERETGKTYATRTLIDNIVTKLDGGG